MEEHARDPLRGLKEALGDRDLFDRHQASERRWAMVGVVHAFIDYPEGHAHRGSCVKCGLLEGQHRA